MTEKVTSIGKARRRQAQKLAQRERKRRINEIGRAITGQVPSHRPETYNGFMDWRGRLELALRARDAAEVEHLIGPRAWWPNGAPVWAGSARQEVHYFIGQGQWMHAELAARPLIYPRDYR